MSELLKINVNEHTEKKNGLTYLSWAWAWAEVLKIDPEATWWVSHWPPETKPFLQLPDGSVMVKVAVTIKKIEREAVLPVMNHRNQAIKNPDAFAINTAIMRCMTKAISMHGLGLYIYAGEDLPEGEEPEPEPEKKDPIPKSFRSSPTMGEFEGLPPEEQQYIRELAQDIETAFKGTPDDKAEAVRLVESQEFNDSQKMSLWSLLDSKTRSAFKKVQQAMREEQAA